MLTLRRMAKPVAHVVMLGFLALTLHIPAVHAGLVGTDAVVNAKQVQQARDSLRATLERDDVKQQLQARGANPEQLQARVSALTDQEAQQLATQLDQLPAGGDDLLGIALFVFIVLLITDIAGYTDIFPFVKKPAHR